jgi:thiamine biosynthesis lipoprotein
MSVPAPFQDRETSLTAKALYFVGDFFAMGCPCQVLIETGDIELAEMLLSKVRDEAWRIEALWSRYLPTSLIQQINEHPEQVHELDAETSAVIDYCKRLWELSDGAFDITSGVLREVWTFDGGTTVPSKFEVAGIMQNVGWHRVEWASPSIKMQQNMQIDLGGVGKEYAVDLCVTRLRQFSDVSCLVNFGGDCAVSHPPTRQPGWRVGVESADTPGSAQNSLSIATGALATSGNAHRYICHQGKRLSHILDARTGWPVRDAPRSVTVQAHSCLEAGMFATLACLQGPDAANVLTEADLMHWIQV